jgi:hypothetical protein
VSDWVFREEDTLALATIPVKSYTREERGRPERVTNYTRGAWWIPHPDWERGQQRWITAGELAYKERGEAARAKDEAADKAADAAAEHTGTDVATRGADVDTARTGTGGAAAEPGVVGKGTPWERPEHGYQRPDPERLVRERGTYKQPGDHPFFQQVPMSEDNLVKAYDDATKAEKYQGRRWYPDGHRLAWAMGGGDPVKGAAMLSAYSPRTGWPVNLYNAARSLAENRALGPGEGLIMGSAQKAAQKVLDGADIDTALPGPKTNAFARLLAMGQDHPDDPLGQVVVDTHAMSAAAGHRLTKEEAAMSPIGKQPFYDHVADMYRGAARTVSERDGEEVSPSELQATAWLRQQRINDAADQQQAEAGSRAAKGRIALASSMRTHWARWEKFARQQGIPTELGTTALAPVPITPAEARGDSRPVSAAEFHQVAAKGRDMLHQMEADTGPVTGLVSNWTSLQENAWQEVQKPWGGLTIDAHSGEALASDADKYALTVKPPGVGSISVPEGATQQQFEAAMNEALVKFRALLEQSNHYLGIFHDDDNHRIDIDPVVVTDSREDAEALGAYTHNIGGAYNFADGNGYFPPHIQE